MEESKGQQAMVRRSTRVRTLTYKAQAIEDEKQKIKEIAKLPEVRKKKIELCKKARAAETRIPVVRYIGKLLVPFFGSCAMRTKVCHENQCVP